jgi:uncharacterized protein YecE (DUF72 family)
VFSVITSAMAATTASVTGAYVGASGFSYPSWRGGFYPGNAKPAEFLELYSEVLPSVELNNSFYRLPSEEQFRNWAEKTPSGFRFAVKMNRQITHFGRFDLIPTFCERVRILGERLGPVRLQFPDNRQRDDGMLQLVLDSLDPELEYAFDFRHESWGGAAIPVRVDDVEAAAPFRYLRFRDPPYDDEALRILAERIRPLLEDGIRVFAYFKHEDEPTAPAYAGRLLALLG